MQSTTPGVLLPLVWPLPRSLATTSGISFDFSSSPYLDVSVQAVPLVYLCIQYTMTVRYHRRIAPFRNPRIIMPICGSPWLIAAYRVFLRLPVPRHSPCALYSLTFCVSHRIMCCFVLFSSSLSHFLSPISRIESLQKVFPKNCSFFTLLSQKASPTGSTSRLTKLLYNLPLLFLFVQFSRYIRLSLPRGYLSGLSPDLGLHSRASDSFIPSSELLGLNTCKTY